MKRKCAWEDSERQCGIEVKKRNRPIEQRGDPRVFGRSAPEEDRLTLPRGAGRCTDEGMQFGSVTEEGCARQRLSGMRGARLGRPGKKDGKGRRCGGIIRPGRRDEVGTRVVGASVIWTGFERQVGGTSRRSAGRFEGGRGKTGRAQGSKPEMSRGRVREGGCVSKERRGTALRLLRVYRLYDSWARKGKGERDEESGVQLYYRSAASFSTCSIHACMGRKTIGRRRGKGMEKGGGRGG